MTLTVLNITNPENPQIVGSTLVTQEASYIPGDSGGKLEAASLGNGDFLVSDVALNGKPVVLLVDPSDPNNLAVSAISVPSAVHGITVAGDLMYATTASGLSIYQVGQLISDPVTISVQVPTGTSVSGSFNDPATITTSGNVDTLEWTRNFAYGSTSFTFTWQSSVSNIQAGQTQDVTLGTTLDFTTQGTPGTVTLPATTVTGVAIIGVSPASQTAQPGATATYDVRLFNPTGTGVNYSLGISGLPQDWTTNLPGSVSVPADGSVNVSLVVTSGVTDPLGTTSFTVTAENGDGASGSATASFTLAGQPVLVPDDQSHGIVASITPTQATAGQGTSAQYVVQLTNTGSAEDTFSLAATGLPTGVTATFGEATIDIPPGASNFRDMRLSLSVAKGTTPGSYPFTVTATSTSDPTVTSATNGTLTMTAGGVQVTLNPGSGAPGSGFQATVTNTGTVADTYNLALAGPAALVASLGTMKVTLAPGASQVVPISTGAVDFAVQGMLGLTAMATSTTNPAIQNAASADLAIPATSGMTAEFSPATQTLSAPGTATFLLMVHNTGNTEDSYSATIIGANGPITATLVGLDGSPTQSIPTFILPGLSTGAIELQVDLSAVGTGTVTVQVKSLTKAETASPDAVTILNSVRVQPQPKPSPTLTPGPQVVKVQRYGYHAMPTTLVLTFDQALDPATAEDVHNYRIVGLHGHRIKILRAVYDATLQTVTLHPAQRLSIHHHYRVTVIGTGLQGVSNTSGQQLDSVAGGRPGDDHLTLTGRDLVLDHVSRRFLIQNQIIRTDPPSKVRHKDPAPATHAKRVGVHPHGPLRKPGSASGPILLLARRSHHELRAVRE